MHLKHPYCSTAAGRAVDSSLTTPCLHLVQVFKDFHACRWPEHFDARDTSLAQHFDQMNAESVDTVAHSLQCQSSAKQNRSPVITFSHYLPFQVHSDFLSAGNQFPCQRFASIQHA